MPALLALQLLLLLASCQPGRGQVATQDPTTAPGSRNVEGTCYADPASGACKEYRRADADWLDDLAQACAAQPHLAGCSLYQQCQNGQASGTYCDPSSLAANVCLEAPEAPGCEAYAALCAREDGTRVALCSVPGPLPTRTTAARAKAAIESLCAKACMDGCGDCGAGKDWSACSDPLLTLAWMCRSASGLPECGAVNGAGYDEMCVNINIAMTFQRTCLNPPQPTARC